MYFHSRESPYMIMMCGLPGSGKSSLASKIQVYNSQNIVEPIHIHSSDDMRKELFGDESIQGDNNKLFNELHKRIKCDLIDGIHTIYDATNISSKLRKQFLSELKHINCYPICIVMATEYRTCLQCNKNRVRQVPEDVIRRMLLHWNPPNYSEGFAEILYNFNSLDIYKNDYTIKTFFERANVFNQCNKHHSLTLGEHCEQTGTYIQNHRPNDFWLLVAALLHDNGKLDTQTKLNAKGIDDGDCHYYQHHCVGSYNILQYLNNMNVIDSKIITYVSNLIYYHMHPYNSWKQSSKVLNRDIKMLGEDFYNDVMLLHEADLSAH